MNVHDGRLNDSKGSLGSEDSGVFEQAEQKTITKSDTVRTDTNENNKL